MFRRISLGSRWSRICSWIELCVTAEYFSGLLGTVDIKEIIFEIAKAKNHKSVSAHVDNWVILFLLRSNTINLASRTLWGLQEPIWILRIPMKIQLMGKVLAQMPTNHQHHKGLTTGL